MKSILRLAVVSLFVFPSPSRASDVDGLVGWWTFDEQEGERVPDMSTNGHEGTMMNGSWGDGISGGALLFDGGNDSIVTVPMTEEIRATANSITLMAWTYRDAEHNVAVVASSYPMLFFGFHGPQFKLELTERPGLLRRVASKIGLAKEVEVECYADLQYVADLGRWIHIAATFDGETARLYADGSEVCALPFTGEIGYSDEPLTIGAYLDHNGVVVDEISGRLDDVRIYNRALTAAEVKSYYDSTSTAVVRQ
jgi:Concanavalin A-like lectin/glucanases superfamily